jgi:homotetrameric cytidine deaminase
VAGVAVAHDREPVRKYGVIDDGEALGHGRDDNLAKPLDASMRNVELKARDPDPARTLERALALGADDRGEIRQRDTYFSSARGRLKLREQETGGSPLWDELIEYSREDSVDARTSTYRRVPVADAAPLREALDAVYGTLGTVTKRRRLLLWEGVRIHLDEVEGLGSFLELEAVAEVGSDLGGEGDKVQRLRDELGIADRDLVATSYSDLLLGAPDESPPASHELAPTPDELAPAPDELMRAADEVMKTAYAPHSNFPVGAALRAPDGSIHVGSNVENKSYPEGQCAETSAIGALIAAGHRQIVEVAVTAGRMDICPPCGGCRQRLAEFAGADTPVYLGRPGGPRETTTIGELLPLAFELK